MPLYFRLMCAILIINLLALKPDRSLGQNKPAHENPAGLNAEEKFILEHPNYSIYAIAFSPDGNSLGARGIDAPVGQKEILMLWDMPGGTEKARLNDTGFTLCEIATGRKIPS